MCWQFNWQPRSLHFAAGTMVISRFILEEQSPYPEENRTGQVKLIFFHTEISLSDFAPLVNPAGDAKLISITQLQKTI